MEEFVFSPFTITDKQVKLDDYNINPYNLLEFLFLSSTPKKIANIFNELIESNVIKIEENQEYEVEAILDEAEEDGEKVYLVKWKNWHIEFCTWEPKENLINCEEEFREYEKRKSENRKGGLGLVIDYTQPKLELINQIFRSITECHIKPSHVYKYLPTQLQSKSTKRKKHCHISLPNKKRKKIVLSTIKDALSDWETLINETYPLFKVTVENTVDTEGPPLDFQFITDYVSSSIEIHSDPPIACHCTTSCLDNRKDCSSIHGGDPPYTVTGKVIPKFGVPIYECNTACLCDLNCPYRVVQRGVKLQLKIFRTKNRGWGLKTLTKIIRGNFIMEYLGEIVTVDEAEERGKLYDQQNLTYLFDLDFAGDPEFTVDAYKKGNMSHFINHSCNPNMTSRCVFINNLDIRMPRIAFFAARDIRAGEELTFDYMMTGAISDNKENEGSVVSTSTSSINVNTKYEAGSESTSSLQITGRVPCLCKSEKCRKFLY